MIDAAKQEENELLTRPGNWDKYGGFADGPKFEAMGHFYTAKHEGKWYLVTPDGNLFWSHGAAIVAASSDTTLTDGRKELFLDDVPERGDYLVSNLKRVYGENWQDAVQDLIHRRFESWGMNTFACWSSWGVCLMGRTPYITNAWSEFPADVRGADLLDDAWVSRLENNIKYLAEHTAGDPYCIGYFIDNEVKVGFMIEDWSYYYKTVASLIKKYAPNKLYFGSRLDFHTYPRANQFHRDIGFYHDVVRQASKYCDVVSFNLYRYTLANFTMPEDKPAIIGEFHFGALDRGILHPGLKPVISQEQRGEAYRMYVESCLRNPFIVGTGWFQYNTQPLTGRNLDGENFQIGLVDICNRPYKETVDAVTDVGRRIYEIRLNKHNKAVL
jgi:hypothetical protein